MDDVSCDNSRAERVGRILAASFTAINIVYERKQHIRPGGGDVSLRLRVRSAPDSAYHDSTAVHMLMRLALEYLTGRFGQLRL